jgi:hypothetical protein
MCLGLHEIGEEVDHVGGRIRRATWIAGHSRMNSSINVSILIAGHRRYGLFGEKESNGG